MSGGHFDYEFNRIRDMYEGEMHDDTLNALLIDFCKLLHDLEWWQSADTSEKDYRNTVQWFKNKWLGKERTVPIAEFKFDKVQLEGIVEKAMADILAQIKRPQGKWIVRYDTEWHFECNQCKGLSPWKAQFCGVCGADMRGDEK